jgi:hypothetical protein
VRFGIKQAIKCCVRGSKRYFGAFRLPLGQWHVATLTQAFSNQDFGDGVHFAYQFLDARHERKPATGSWQCSFDAFIAKYQLQDAALDKLALVVRGADCGQPELAKEAAGLLAISKGLSLNFMDDHEMLAHGLVIYDALYAWCADTPFKKVARFLGLK